MSRASFVANSCIIMVLMSLLAAVAFLSVSPWYFFGLGKSNVFHLGYVQSKHNSLYLSVEAAVEDINHSVRRLSPSPPEIRLHTAFEEDEVTKQFQKLYEDEAVRIFLVASESDTRALQKLISEYSEASVVTLSVLDEDNGLIIGTNMPLRQEIRGYLDLMASHNPTEKPLNILPVWENLPHNKKYYDLLVSEIEANYKNILKLTLPVTYEASQYPRSDGIQAVSEISSRLVLNPDSHIFFLSSTRLREVIEATKMNKALVGRRWYARGLLEEDQATLEAIESAEFSKRTSLTILSYMASEDSEERRELLRLSMERETSVFTYLNGLAYATVYDLHKTWTHRLYMQTDFEATFLRLNKSENIIKAGLTFKGENPVVLPLDKWMVGDIVTNEAVEAVPTHPLYKSELEALLNASQEVCPNAGIKLGLHPSLILPRVSMTFEAISEVPEVVILPAQKGISVSLLCDLTTSITAYCVPSKFNQGSLTCRVASNFNQAASRVQKRSSESKFTVETLWKDFNENMRPVWSDLAPDAFSCTASLAGCDFCFYYLSTYNLSVAPAACVGGCSLSAFGTCTKVITTSLQKTFLEDPK